MPHNENPALQKGRASRVSFGHWTQEAHIVSDYRTQLLITKYGVLQPVARVLGEAIYGESCNG